MTALRLLRQSPTHLYQGLWCGQHPPYRGQQAVVIDVADVCGALALRVEITDQHRLDGRRGDHRGLQQIGVERQHGVALAGGALGEKRHPIALLEGGRNLVDHPQRIFARGAFNEQSAGGSGHGADEWPAMDFGLGDKAGVAHGVQDQDVEPGNVVGHPHDGAIVGLALHPTLHTHGAQHGLRPMLHRPSALLIRPTALMTPQGEGATPQTGQHTERAPQAAQGEKRFELVSRESFLLGNSVLQVVAMAAVLVAGVSLSAHHSGSTLFNEKPSTLKGVVKTWLWSNPHCLLTIEVTGADGQATQWVFEMQSPNSIYPGGYRRTTFKEGDTVSITAYTVKNGRPYGRLVSSITAEGKELGDGMLKMPSPAAQ